MLCHNGSLLCCTVGDGAWISSTSSRPASGTQTQWLCCHSGESCKGRLTLYHSHSFTHSHSPRLSHSLSHSLIHSLTHSQTLSLSPSLSLCIQNDSGKPTEIHVTTKKSSETAKPKAFIHWVSAPLKCTIRLYDRL